MNSLNPLRFTSHNKNWEKYLLFQSWNDCLLNWAKWQLFSLKIVLGCHLSEKWCRFVNLLSFASSYFFLSLRKIMWPNSQDFLLRTQNEALSFLSLPHNIYFIWNEHKETISKSLIEPYQNLNMSEVNKADKFNLCLSYLYWCFLIRIWLETVSQEKALKNLREMKKKGRRKLASVVAAHSVQGLRICSKR